MVKHVISISLMIILLAACSPAAEDEGTSQTSVPVETSTEDASPLIGVCTFTANATGAPHSVYDSASNTDNVIETLEEGENRTVIGQTESTYMISASNQTGFIAKESGIVEGDCSSLPFMPVLSEAPDGVCAIHADNMTINPVGHPELSIVMSQWLQPLAQSEGGDMYKITLGTDTYWIESAPFQQGDLVSGPCDELPVEETGLDG